MLTQNRINVCETQGELFVLAARKGFKCSEFIRKFMKSEICQYIDEFDEDPYAYSHNPRKGADVALKMSAEEIMEKLLHDEKISAASTDGELYSEEIMRWAGWLYRYWHYYDRCRPSNKIWRKANGQMMKKCYDELHDLEPEQAIARLLEISMNELWYTKR
ncbi:MAG: hypothetical protein KBS66_01000 [Eubacterium sp.]|nr:hypothetical protein [Candidatus Colimonas fimequi]